jgi:hypothetical protein
MRIYLLAIYDEHMIVGFFGSTIARLILVFSLISLLFGLFQNSLFDSGQPIRFIYQPIEVRNIVHVDQNRLFKE